MRRRSGILATSLFGAILLLSLFPAAKALAGLDVDLGAAIRADDDTSIYLAVSSRYYSRDEGSVQRWNGRCHDPDDLAVALFIARYGHGSPDDVFAMRGKGLTWWQIGVRLGVPAEKWFVPVDGTPGPPYGKAYGHWKKHGRRSPAEMRIDDADARNLVAVRMLHEYYGVSAAVAMQWRASGRGLAQIAAGEYRSRHGKSKGHHDDGARPRHGHGKGKGGR